MINCYNKNILRKQEKPPQNCRDKTSFPLNENSQHKNLAYSCQFSTPETKQNYPHRFDITKHTFKDRVYKHNNSFSLSQRKMQQKFLISSDI